MPLLSVATHWNSCEPTASARGRARVPAAPVHVGTTAALSTASKAVRGRPDSVAVVSSPSKVRLVVWGPSVVALAEVKVTTGTVSTADRGGGAQCSGSAALNWCASEV